MHKLPDNWLRHTLGDVAKVQTGLALGSHTPSDPVHLPYLRVANVQDGYFDLSEIKTVPVERKRIARHTLRVNDVLLTEGGDNDKLGRGHIWRGEIPDCLHQNHIFAVRVENGTLRPEYFAAICSSDYGRAYFRDCSKQSTNLASINKTQVEEMVLPLPPTDEQDAILSKIGPFSRCVDLLDSLIGLKRRLRDGLMQQLLTGRCRLPAFANQPWHEVHIGDLFEQNDRFVDWNDDIVYDLVSVRRWAGGVYTRDRIVGSDIKVKTLKQIQAGDILISHIQSAYGAMTMVGDDHDGHYVSDLYMVLVPKDASQCDSRFFAWMCRTKWMWHQATVASNGFKAERLRILFDPAEFLRRRINVPATREEQAAIADVLDTATREIEALTRLRDAIAKQKRGLMQKLLTGEIRVPVAETASEGRRT